MSSGESEFWVAPERIRFKISPHSDLSGEQGGDWDIDRRYPVAQAVKHRAIWQRYKDGARWEDTDLFRDTYRRRLETGTVRGCATMKALLEQYYTRVDGLFADMKANGFQIRGSLPLLLIGRDGVFIGNQGNHRLAIAQVLGLDTIAGRILCRHPLSRQ